MKLIDTRTGHQVIEDALQKAATNNAANSPFPMVGAEAIAFQKGLAAAYLHALEMIPATDMVIACSANWRRICQALDTHHPQWIDGNGSAIDKVIKFIEEVKS